MTFPIQMTSLSSAASSPQISQGSSASDVQKSFANELSEAFNQINNTENQADNLVTQMAGGNVDNLHNVMIAVEKSEIMLRLAVQVRDKAVSAYQEIMRMQV
ncbi:MAG: flagellar hook-basal body complex protein FliE [Tuberibacillus sp.]